MGSRRKRRVLWIAGAVVVAALAVWAFLGDSLPFGRQAEEESYRSFYEQLEAGRIQSVTINGDRLRYTKKGDDGQFSTQNPGSPALKETLLLHDVEVRGSKDAAEAVSLALDILFYAFFAAVIVMVLRRLVGPGSFKVVRRTGVTFGDVVGMDGLKRDMMQAVAVMRSPEEYARRGIRMPKGIILEGAPGNGKTLFARALAGEAGVSFIATKATDFESMFMAIGPMKVKLLFRKARRHSPCIVFIDEFDGIGTRRNYSGSAIETENTRIVTALLNELDGFVPAAGVLVLAATNSLSALDEALVRPGRFDSRVSVPFPDEASRRELVEMYGRGKNLSEECSPGQLSRTFSGFSCAKIESVLNRARMIASQRGESPVTMQDIQQAVSEQKGAV